MELICPKCGASSLKKPFVGDFCLECHLESKKKVLPSQIEIVICPMSGLMRVSGKGEAHQQHQRYNVSKKRVGEKWVKPDNALIKQIVKRPFKRAGFECKYKPGNDYISIFFEGAGGEKIEYKHPIEIRYKKVLSPMAGRAAGGYFEAIIQLRGDSGRFESAKKKISRELERHTFIAKEADNPEGPDIYVGQKAAIIPALKRLGMKYLRSSKLSGQRRDGKRLYRDTFLIRFEKKENQKGQDRDLNSG